MSNPINNYISFLFEDYELCCKLSKVSWIADYHWTKKGGVTVMFFDTQSGFFYVKDDKLISVVGKYLGVTESIAGLYIKYWCKNEIRNEETSCNK